MGEQWWTVTLKQRGLRVGKGTDGEASSDDGAGSVRRSTVAASPDRVLLCLWGRLGNDAVATSGSPELDVLRKTLTRVTG